jgi:hypothetical protein
MVKLGFIAEGATEKIILESSDFRGYLRSLSIDFIEEVIDAGGNGNLLPNNILPHTRILEEKGATKIFVLTDLDETLCITRTKERIKPLPNHIIIVSVKTIEAWFLADSESMRSVLNDSTFFVENPELISNPFEEIKKVRLEKTRKITNSKVILANLFIKHHGFSIQNAAKHPNCSSAKYFLETIRKIAANR